MTFDVLVIGGGVNGLATAYHLSQHKNLKIGLIEQFSLGHVHGSSHGFSRIFRSTYTNPVYTLLTKRARKNEWPALEKDSGCRLVHPSPRCVFGVPSVFDGWAKAILANDSNSDIELLDVSAARRLFPQFRFSDSLRVLQDRSSGVIAAQDTMRSLTKLSARRNVKFFEETKVLKISSAPDCLQLETTKGILTSKRLILRPWKKEDLESLSRLNADPRTMEFLFTPLTREESSARLQIYKRHIEDYGWGLWAVSAPGVSDFIGWIGLWPIGFDSHFTPAIEVGWRLLPEFWGQGYATEGAEASLQYGFDTLKLDEIVSITVPANLRSKRVMEKLGMHTDPKDDFDHPKLPEGHPLKRHVLYRLKRSEWQRRVDMP